MHTYIKRHLFNIKTSIIGTPGRIMHIIKDAEYSLATVSVCVFDEADRLFEMGFAEQLTEIVKSMSDTGVRQTMLFSATLPSV